MPRRIASSEESCVRLCHGEARGGQAVPTGKVGRVARGQRPTLAGCPFAYKGKHVLDRGVSGLTPSAIVVFGCVRTEHDYIYVLGPLAEGLAEGSPLVFVFDNHSLGLAPEPGGPTSTRATREILWRLEPEDHMAASRHDKGEGHERKCALQRASLGPDREAGLQLHDHRVEARHHRPQLGAPRQA